MLRLRESWRPLQDCSALDYRGKIADESSWQTSRVKYEIDTVTHGRLLTKNAVKQQLANQDKGQPVLVRDKMELNWFQLSVEHLSQMMCNITDGELESLEAALPNTDITHATGGGWISKKLLKAIPK